jgi:hypothetical protein
MRINLSRKTFLWSWGIGAVIALLSLWSLHGGHNSAAGHLVWTLIYPFLTAADRVTTEVFFTHDRIAPSLGEPLVIYVIFDLCGVDRLHRQTLFTWTVGSDWNDETATESVERR